MIYLDNSATTRQYDEVTDLVYKLSKEAFGNPSSLHTLGLKSAELIREARGRVSKAFPANGEIIFNSGGTEGDNTAIFSTARKLRRRGNKIITSKIEHPAVMETCRKLADEGLDVCYLDVDKSGAIKLESLEDALDDNVILVTLMTVNNETGMIQPVVPAYDIVKTYNKEHGTNIVFHTDAVQAFGKMNLRNVPFDIITISGHKVHAPKGVGAMYMKSGLKLPTFIPGGGQESGHRSGTENTHGIAGLGLATELAYDNLTEKQERLATLNNRLREGIISELDDIIVNGTTEMGFEISDYGKRCPSVLNISFLGSRGEVILHTLEQEEIYVSTGSACSSHKNSDSHVLAAMGLGHKEIEGAIRFSISEFNTLEEMDEAAAKVSEAVKRFRRLGSFR